MYGHQQEMVTAQVPARADRADIFVDSLVIKNGSKFLHENHETYF